MTYVVTRRKFRSVDPKLELSQTDSIYLPFVTGDLPDDLLALG